MLNSPILFFSRRHYFPCCRCSVLYYTAPSLIPSRNFCVGKIVLWSKNDTNDRRKPCLLNQTTKSWHRCRWTVKNISVGKRLPPPPPKLRFLINYCAVYRDNIERTPPMIQARTQGGGSALGARATPPTWKESSAQKCPKEERNFRPDMSAKRNVHVPLRYHKIKTEKLGKKEENSKKKGLELKKWRKGIVVCRNYTVDVFHVYLPLLLFWTQTRYPCFYICFHRLSYCILHFWTTI